MNNDLIQTLQNYWFSEKEAKVYLTVLALWAAPASSIARNANENRTSAYFVLLDLVKKWYCSRVVREKVTYFSAIHPELLLKIQEEKQEKLREKMPELTALIPSWWYKPQMLVFEWVDGIKKVYEDTLNYPDSTMKSFYGHSTAIQKMKKREISLEKWLDHVYLPRRLENRILAKVLMSGDEEVDKAYVDLTQQWETAKYTQHQYIKHNMFFTNETILYWDDKIAISVISDDEIWWVIIKSKALYTTLDTLFTLLWKE